MHGRKHVNPCFMKTYILVTCSLLIVLPCLGQQFQIIKPDSSVFKSVSINQYVSVVTNARQTFSGKLTSVTPNAITLDYRGRLVNVSVVDIIKAKKTSKFGICASRLSPYAAIVPILIIPSATSAPQQDKTFAGKFLVSAAIILPTGIALALLMNLPPYKKTKRGYSFRVVQ